MDYYLIIFKYKKCEYVNYLYTSETDRDIIYLMH